jgi:hypothetical protein
MSEQWPWLADAAQAMLKLARYADARDRAIDREPRTITLTDDEARGIIALVEHLQGGPLRSDLSKWTRQ